MQGFKFHLPPRFFALRYFGAHYLRLPYQTPAARIVEVPLRLRTIDAAVPEEEPEEPSRVAYVGARSRVAYADERTAYWSTR